jgi:hypothetical protein
MGKLEGKRPFRRSRHGWKHPEINLKNRLRGRRVD